jgi:hypothetical protein
MADAESAAAPENINDAGKVLNMWWEISERNRCGRQAYNERIDEPL